MRSHKTRDQLIIELQALGQKHRRTQKALQERDHLSRLLVEHSLGLMCVHDLDGVLLAINPAAAESMGYRPEDGIGRNLRDFLAPAVRPNFAAYLSRIRTQPIDSGLLRLVAGDGRERVWAYRNVRYDEPGQPPRVLGHALDITERVEAEQALRESEERFRLLTEHARDLIVLIDRQGLCRYVSPSCEAMLGYAPAALLGTRVLDLVHADERRRLSRWPTRGLHEFRVRHADGHWIWLEGSAALVTWQGTPHVVGIARDIGERRRAQEERAARLAQEQAVAREQEARAQIEAALRQRDDVLALATHDLRTPLTSVLGWAQLVRLRAQSATAVDATWLDAQMQALITSATRMLTTIEEIGDVTQLQLGRQLDLRWEEVDVAALAREVAAEYAGSAGVLAITVNAPAEPSATVWGDQARLRRVLQNLVDNAVRYSAPDAPVEITVAGEQQGVVVIVHDHGVGIPAAELSRVFTRFYRATTARGTRGSGLGLAGVQAIVTQHGGHVHIASVVDQGTTVTVHLPSDPIAASPPAGRPQS